MQANPIPKRQHDITNNRIIQNKIARHNVLDLISSPPKKSNKLLKLQTNSPLPLIS